MNQATFSLNVTAVSTLEVTLHGGWLMQNSLPTHQPLKSVLVDYQISAVIFKAANHFQWDSKLMAWLLECQRHLAAISDAQFDFHYLPVEISELWQLANAVTPNVETPPIKNLQQQLLDKLEHIGDSVLNNLAFIGGLCIAFYHWAIGRGSARWADIMTLCHQSGPQALPIITLQSVLVGMILAYLGVVQLKQFGAEVYVSDLVALGMVREMGALMTAIVMSGRTGAAYAAQLGTMQVNEEIDALTTLGIKPMDYLIVPRTLALLITIPLLSLYSNILGMIGGGLVATGMNITWRMYLFQIQEAITFSDIATGLFKSFIFAALIAIAGCRAGLACGRSSAAVGQATTNAVVAAIIYLVVADAALNIIYYHLGI